MDVGTNSRVIYEELDMNVGIGSDYFHKELRAYSNWRWAWPREICQNSIDCGANELKFDITEHDGDTLAIAENNGPPMTKEILLQKFLSLGGTTKEGTAYVGGFGIAKIVIALAHKSYKIETGNLVVQGCGGEFELLEVEKAFHGTKTTIVMKGDEATALRAQIKRLAALTRWKGTITLNGEELPTHRYRGTYRRSFTWGDIYTNKNAENQLVVRINGVPMFTKHCLLNRQVIIELNGQSSEVLQSSRDSLTYKVQDEFDIFIQELAVDRRSALTQHNIERHLWDGSSLAYRPSVEAIKGILESVSSKETETGYAEKLENGYTEVVPDSAGEGNSLKVGGMTGTVVREEKIKSSPLGYKFLIENSTGMTIPDYYLPGYLSNYSTKLVKNWAAVLLEIYEVFEDTSPFNVGFILDKDGTEAAYCKQDGHSYYLISPAKVVEQLYSRSRSFKNRWNFTPRGKWQIVVTAVHEYTHKQGFSQHDEDFASKLTDNLARILHHAKDFHKCFRE